MINKNKRREGRFLPSGKKGSLGATLTWMIATSIIVFLIVIFLVWVAGIKVVEKDDISTQKSAEVGTKLLSINILKKLLKTDIEVNGITMSVEEAIKEWSEMDTDIQKIGEKAIFSGEIKRGLAKELDSLNTDYYIYFAHDIENEFEAYGADPNALTSAGDFIIKQNFAYYASQGARINLLWWNSVPIYIPDRKIRVGLYVQ